MNDVASVRWTRDAIRFEAKDGRLLAVCPPDIDVGLLVEQTDIVCFTSPWLGLARAVEEAYVTLHTRFDMPTGDPLEQARLDFQYCWLRSGLPGY